MPEDSIDHIDFDDLNKKAISQPLVSHIYTADPSAHVFDGKIYIYPSHDVDAGDAFDDLGSHFAMEDYHILSMDNPTAETIDHGVALHVKDVPWADKQMWAPDASEKDGTYYLFFPAKGHDGIFRIGVATSASPTGPFKPQPEAIKKSFSIDPAVFKDDDRSYYMYFGGIWGGQLQRWRTGAFKSEQAESPVAFLPEDHETALCAKIVKLRDDLLEFAETPKDIVISYSTGDTHYICYAIGDNPYGPFTYAGRILEPVVGWTSHHSICQFKNKWYLFYHDSSLSKGVTHLRSVKVTELIHDENGFIQTIKPYNN